MAGPDIETPLSSGATDHPDVPQESEEQINEASATAAGYPVQHDFSNLKPVGAVTPLPDLTNLKPVGAVKPLDTGHLKSVGAVTPTTAPPQTGEAGRPGTMEEAMRSPSPMAPTVYGLDTVARDTIDALKGAVNSFNPKPQNEEETEAFKTAGIGGMLIYRLVSGLGHPLMNAPKVAAAIHDINQSKDPVGTYLKIAQSVAGEGAGQALVALGTEGAVKGAQAVKKPHIGMEMHTTSDGAQIPVQSPSLAGRLARQAVSPEVVKEITQEKTAPAVKQTVGDILGKATGSKAETILSTETGDSFGVRGHANSLVGEATPVMDRIDELSGGKLTEAKAAKTIARQHSDWDAYNTAAAKEQALFDEYKEPLAKEGLDVDTANAKYRKAMRLDEISTAFERAIDKDTGALSGKKLSNEIGKLVAKGPKKSPLLRGDFTQDHISALREVADVMKDQERPPAPFLKSAAKTLSAVIGAEHGGFAGLVTGVAGESVGEMILTRIADRFLADAMGEPAAAPKVATALKTGNTQPVVDELTKDDPTWADNMKSFVHDILLKGTRGEAGFPGSVFEPERVAELKNLGMTDDEITQLQKTKPFAAPALKVGEGVGGHAGGGVVSAEELARGNKHWMVNKSGPPSFDGASYRPEETQEGGAHVTELPDGTLQTNAGTLTPEMEARVKAAMAARDHLKIATKPTHRFNPDTGKIKQIPEVK